MPKHHTKSLELAVDELMFALGFFHALNDRLPDFINYRFQWGVGFAFDLEETHPTDGFTVEVEKGSTLAISLYKIREEALQMWSDIRVNESYNHPLEI